MRTRTSEFDVVFSGHGGTTEGWAFSVPEGFRLALDILPSGWKADPFCWSQGVPACYRFERGDILYDSPEARRLPWGEARQTLGRTIQILDGAPDQEAGTDLVDGWVSFRLWQGSDLAPQRATVHRLSQHQFVHYLRTGELTASERPRRYRRLPKRPELTLTYVDYTGQPRERVVFPGALKAHDNALYLIGYWKEAKARRAFALDRITRLRQDALGISLDSGIAEYLQSLPEPEAEEGEEE